LVHRKYFSDKVFGSIGELDLFIVLIDEVIWPFVFTGGDFTEKVFFKRPVKGHFAC